MKYRYLISLFTISLLLVSQLHAQNVGIGTTTPGAPLHVYDASRSELLRLQSPSPYLSFYDGSGTYQGFLWKDASNNMVLGTSCANTGNIKLQLGCNDIFTLSPSGVTTLNGTSTQLNLYQGGTYSGELTSNLANLYLNASKANTLTGQTVPGNLLLQAGSGGIAHLTPGNVGIGSTNPTVKLEVLTSDASWGIIHTNGNGTVRVGTYAGSGGGWIATQTNSPLYFATSLLNTNCCAQMTLLTNGNVGIGTLSPSYKLSVNGTIQTKEVRVETGWADYVFDKDYKLPSLTSVEKYIQENKHLQDIPAADDIQKNGLAVGEVQTKMMQKIEELTLYVIELQKQIDELKSEHHAKK